MENSIYVNTENNTQNKDYIINTNSLLEIEIKNPESSINFFTSSNINFDIFIKDNFKSDYISYRDNYYYAYRLLNLIQKKIYYHINKINEDYIYDFLYNFDNELLNKNYLLIKDKSNKIKEIKIGRYDRLNLSLEKVTINGTNYFFINT